MPNSNKGFSRLVPAFQNSMAGLRDIWKGEEAFRMEAIVFLISLPASLWLSQSMTHGMLLISSVLLVLIVETLNSAIESVVDRFGSERHELSRMAKDYGSLAVLLSCIPAALLWGAALWEKLLA